MSDVMPDIEQRRVFVCMYYCSIMLVTKCSTGIDVTADAGHGLARTLARPAIEKVHAAGRTAAGHPTVPWVMERRIRCTAACQCGAVRMYGTAV